MTNETTSQAQSETRAISPELQQEIAQYLGFFDTSRHEELVSALRKQVRFFEFRQKTEYIIQFIERNIADLWRLSTGTIDETRTRTIDKLYLTPNGVGFQRILNNLIPPPSPELSAAIADHLRAYAYFIKRVLRELESVDETHDPAKESDVLRQKCIEETEEWRTE